MYYRPLSLYIVFNINDFTVLHQSQWKLVMESNRSGHVFVLTAMFLNTNWFAWILLNFCAVLPLGCQLDTVKRELESPPSDWSGSLSGGFFIKIRGPSPLWVVLPLNRWAYAVQKSQGEQARRPVSLCGLCLPWFPSMVRKGLTWELEGEINVLFSRLLLAMVFIISQPRKETGIFTTHLGKRMLISLLLCPYLALVS